MNTDEALQQRLLNMVRSAHAGKSRADSVASAMSMEADTKLRLQLSKALTDVKQSDVGTASITNKPSSSKMLQAFADRLDDEDSGGDEDSDDDEAVIGGGCCEDTEDTEDTEESSCSDNIFISEESSCSDNIGYEDIEGEGFIDDVTAFVGKTAAKGKDAAKELGRRFRGILAAFQGERKNFPFRSRKTIKRYGRVPIIRLRVCRTPITAISTSLLNKFLRAVGTESTHDALYHLFVICTLVDGTEIRIEKNAVLNVERWHSREDVPEICKDLQSSEEVLTVNDILNKTLKFMTPALFYPYSAIRNNCQSFIAAIIQANDLAPNSVIKDFVLQNIDQLLPKWIEEIVLVATSTASRVDLLTKGEGKPSDEIQSP